MKLTNFYSFLDVKGHHYLLNTLNSALIELDEKHYKELQDAFSSNNPNTINKNAKDILAKNGFLIENSTDEYLMIRNKYLSSKYRISNNLRIDIAITNKCNFSCLYCFERFSKNKISLLPNDEIKNSFSKNFNKYLYYMIRNYKIESLKIVWYGGEPSLEWPLIFSLNEEFIETANRNHIKYSNMIITNGFLTDENVAKRLSQQNVEYVQVTIDGPEEIHNKRRPLINGKGTYSKILDGVLNLLKNNVNTVIRINIDKGNIDYIDEFIDDLYKRFKKFVDMGLLSLNFGRVFGYKGSLSISEFYEKHRNFVKKAVKLGFIRPSIKSAGIKTYCSAETDALSNLTIDIFGRLYKCWNYVFDKNFDFVTIDQLIKSNFKLLPQNENRVNYVERASLLNANNGKCLKCKYLPYCGGLCPDTRLRIMAGAEENIYNGEKCKLIVGNLIKDQIELIYLRDGDDKSI